MPTYLWLGINHHGKKISGTETANSLKQLKESLVQQNIFPLKIQTIAKTYFWQNDKINQQQINTFIEQLAILINANIPLTKALDIISQDEKSEHLKKLVLECKNTIFTGQSLTKTLAQHPKYFNELICNLINIGEQSGTLDIILNELSIYLTKVALQKRKIIRALLYPITVLNIALVITVIMLLFVIPQFKTMYNSFGADLPRYTQYIINLSDFLQNYWGIIASGIITIVISIKIIYCRIAKFSRYLHDINLKIPIIKNILIYTIISRLTKTIGLAYKAGVPLLKAINLATTTVQNWRYQMAMHNVATAINNGKSFHATMNEQKLFPTIVIQLIALGEETGSLDIMLEKIATIYDEKLHHLTDNLNNLLEPIIILILGIIVGSLIIGMYLPIFRLGTVV